MGSLVVGWTAVPFFLRMADEPSREESSSGRRAETSSGLQVRRVSRRGGRNKMNCLTPPEQDQLKFYLDSGSSFSLVYYMYIQFLLV